MTEYDPTESLEVIRKVVDRQVMPATVPVYVRSALQEFEALDEWMSNGGRAPADWRTRRRGRPPLTEDGVVNHALKLHQHGTRYGYNHGCKCGPCRAANRGEDPAVIQQMKVERNWA